MDGISTSEAVGYGLKHMVQMGFVYLTGFALMAFGIFVLQDNIGLAVVLIPLGLAIILGGLHGAIYKMAGDATARVLSRADASAQPAPSSTDTDDESEDEEEEGDPEPHPDPGISGT